ncbi:SIR2 family protein [Providencia rettgeri]|uniref:SIR2 family protein n=1 Tax=unclassified Providencia TaxID=2633465 RepID=UPI001BD22CC1|nr:MULTISPECIES: SIR2 family protein [unclassified Providencia]ELR5117306.1 SIR2 family protein [Providencia rettgeri]HBK4774985.1 SIR2 family protein [Providencia rettgeri]HEF8780617.1 SIR2 family protein [Providencia rettgeri]
MPEPIFNFKNYPIIFIGSGISKRYIKNFPAWEGLLEEYWKVINKTDDFYSYLLDLKKKYSNHVDDADLNHKIYTEAASFIEEKYNNLFSSGDIKLDGLTTKKVFNDNISPFKYSICQRFEKLELRDDINLNEYESFKSLLKKAKMIVTTNYDCFIENILHDQGVKPRKYIGNEGFFDDTVGWSELYKIHGDVAHPHSIIINKDDYDEYDKKSILISAKILSNMIKSPIIFMGYSLSDRNVKKLLSDFSSQLPKEDGRVSSERIILVEYKKNESLVLKQQTSDQLLHITYTSISTDNYKQVYDDICLVDEGLSPYDVLRYQRAIKNLIINEGEKGNLDNLLVTPSDLDKLEESVRKHKNLVVALGDKKFVFTHIKESDYIDDYIKENNEISIKPAIDFIIEKPFTTRIPFSKFINNCDFTKLELSRSCVDKLNGRINAHGTLEGVINSVKLDKVYSEMKLTSIKEIQKENLTKYKELMVIIKNIKLISKVELNKFVKTDALHLFKTTTDGKEKTELRRLFLAYDLLTYGEVLTIIPYIEKKAAIL